MITPSYSIAATERILPRLALDFTTAVTDPRVVTTRSANTATRINSSGVIELVNANLARYDFDPATGVCKGQLVEDTRINLFLNSLIDGTNLSTQNVTLSAIAYTLSFYGSGSITISGGHSAVVTGLGNYPNRKTYTFTPSSGSSTFTVSGDVKWAQIEAGAFATSFIPTAGTSVQRNFDNVGMTGANFTGWFLAGVGTLYAEASQPVIFAASRSSASISTSGVNNPRLSCYRQSAGTLNGYAINSAGAGNGVSGGASATADATHKTVLSYSATNAQRVCANGNAGNTMIVDMTTSMATLNSLAIGADFIGSSNTYCGHIRKIMWWPLQMTTAEAQAFSK